MQAGETRPCAVGYVRVSTVKQVREGHSLEAQRDALLTYANTRGYDLVDILIEEGVSGTKPLADRPEGGRLLEMIRTGTVQHVITWSLSRLFRDIRDCADHASTWRKNSVGLHLLDKDINTSSDQGFYFLMFLAIFAEMEADMISERTSFIAQQRKAQGKVYTGSRPYGFRADGDDLIPDQTEQRILAMFLRIQAKYDLSYNHMARKANRRGIPAPRGGAWSRQTMQRVLQDTTRKREVSA